MTEVTSMAERVFEWALVGASICAVGMVILVPLAGVAWWLMERGQ